LQQGRGSGFAVGVLNCFQGIQLRRRHDSETGQGIEDILHGLNGADSGAAWACFVDRYSALIMRTVRQFEFEQERADDCFLHVCEKLCDGGFRRLLQFNTEGPAHFSTWLGSVVYNLCVDWHRAEYGRAVLLPAISAMPVFDQAVYRLYFERRMDRESCRRTLAEEFPGLTRAQLAEAIARVHHTLTPRQRWRLSVERLRPQGGEAVSRDIDELPDRGLEPESEFMREERRLLVQRALAGLSRRQRLLLQMRYEQGLTLKKIAQLMDLADPFRARREIQAALDELAAAMPVADLKRH